MDFVSLTSTPDPGIGLAVTFAGLAIGVAGLAISMLSTRRRPKLLRGLGIMAVLTWAVGLVMTVTMGLAENQAETAMMEKRKAEVVNVYGLKLTDSEYEKLRFPETEPEEKFAVFGSITQDAEKPGGGFERQTVFLIWQFGKLQLAQSADGETFTVLGGEE